MIQIKMIAGGETTIESFLIDREKEEATYHFSKREVPKQCNEIHIDLKFLEARTGDKGYYIFPDAMVCFLTQFKERKDLIYECDQNNMPVIGAKLGEDAYLIVMEKMRYNYRVRLKVVDGNYSLCLVYDLKKHDLYEDIQFQIYKLSGKDADYSGIARKYRKLQVEKLQLVPLAERVHTEPVIAYACQNMPMIRIRLAWKPVPTPVLEQTLEDEPPMHVACTFAQVEELMEEMKNQGIEKAEINLVGWNCKGHDGRWPQMFPVEEELGGEEGLKKLISHAKQLGYQISCHTNNADCYRIADCWDEADVVKTKQGELQKNENAWSGGQMYDLCPKASWDKYFRKDMDELGTFGFQGFHYIDVLTVHVPRTCYDKRHPLTPEQTAEYYQKMLQYAGAKVGCAGSEGGVDFAIPGLDFVLYVSYNLLDGMPEVADEVIPFWQMVYHGYVLSNSSAETVNYSIKHVDNRLKQFEFGGIPVIYFYSRFVGENGMKNWMGDQDMYCGDEMQRRESVAIMKHVIEEHAPYAERQLAFMDKHHKLQEGVYETVYSDGYSVIVNYNEKEYRSDRVCVPAKGMVQLEPER